nr:MAG TPA: hypothetical protein [Caudoviricetes sp.]
MTEAPKSPAIAPPAAAMAAVVAFSPVEAMEPSFEIPF